MSTSLLDWILSILRDPEAREAFQSDPDRYATAHGFQDLSPADVHDALCLIADNQSASYDHHNNHVHYPPPKHYDHHDDGPRYLNNYIHNEYRYVDDRDTTVDNSVHQRIDTDGGDFHQTIDNDPVIASGDGAVAAGDDIRDSQVTTGDRNVVGDDNQAVTGSHNTTAFGSGDATDADFSDSRFGDGSGVSVGGDAHGFDQDNDTATSVRGGDGDTTVSAAGHGGYSNQYADQSDTDNSEHHDYDVKTHVEDNSQDNSHNDTEFHHVGH
jgi:hypothetical protein